MKTLHELKCYLVKENFNMNSIYINEPNVAEGLSLEGYDNTWTLSFVERRKKSIQKEFTNEKDLVKYALAKLRGNKWYKSKIIAFVHTEKEIKEVEEVLKAKDIYFERNDMPLYRDGPAYRIFVFGNDEFKVKKVLNY